MSFKKDLLKGTKWTSIEQLSVVCLSLLRLAILARLLKKETFGLFAIVLLIQGFTTIFADLGISVSLFHKKEIKKEAYCTLYWLNIFINSFLYGILFLCIPIFVSYFKDSRLVELIPIMGVNLILLAIGKHFQVYAQKELKFKALALSSIFSNFLGFLLSVYLAWNHYEIYALIIPVLLISFTSSVCYFILMRTKYPLFFVFQFQEAKSFFKVGLYQSAGQIIGFIAKQLDIIIIGRFLNQELLGVYNLLKQFTMRIYGLINSIMTKVSIPVFSNFNDDENLLKKRFIQIVTGLSFINAIIYSLVAFFAYEILFIMYGSSFVEYELHFRLFCIIYYLSAIASPAGILVVAKGKTQYGMYWAFFRVVVSIPLLYLLGSEYKLIGILIATLIFSAQSIYTYWLVMIKRVQSNIGYVEYAKTFFPSLIMGSVVFSLCYLIYGIIPLKDINIILQILLKVVLFSVISFIYIYFIHKDKVQTAFALIGPKLKENKYE